MKKKILAVMLSAFMVFAFVACGDNDASNKSQESGTKDSQESGLENRQESNADDVDIDDQTENDEELAKFSETLTFMGYTFKYPESLFLDHYMYGHTFNNKDIFLLLEAPAIAAEILDVTDVNDAPSAVEEYVLETIETHVIKLFNFDETTQTITNSEVITINDIEMLRVEGIFTNIAKNRDIPLDVPFVGYYFLRDNQPVYFVGVPLNEDVTVDSFMDEFAGYVVDIKE